MILNFFWRFVQMKYCSKCGHQCVDEASICLGCGCAFDNVKVENRKASGMQTAAKVFMILGTIINAIFGFLIPLAWCLPMTISYCNKTNQNDKVGTGFKVCSLLFVSLLGGIFMLCDKE